MLCFSPSFRGAVQLTYNLIPLWPDWPLSCRFPWCIRCCPTAFSESFRKKALDLRRGRDHGGTAVSLAGNMHYVVYRWVLPLLSKLQGVETTESYWFPDATRYIGFDPDVPDKTIHEFPCYSFVLGICMPMW